MQLEKSFEEVLMEEYGDDLRDKISRLENKIKVLEGGINTVLSRIVKMKVALREILNDDEEQMRS